MFVGGISYTVYPRTPSADNQPRTYAPAAEPVNLLTPEQASHVLASTIAWSEVPMPDAEALRTLQATRGLGS